MNTVFNQMVDYYDRYRPQYPTEIIDKIVTTASLTCDSRIIEIGAGSGKATSQFIDYNIDILCIEPGKALAEKGIERFKGNKVSYIISLFEDCVFDNSAYDAIIAAQSFHWVKKPEGYKLCAQALKNNGFLMPFWNIEIISDINIDHDVYDIITRYDGYTAVLKEDAYYKRSENIVADIENCGYFTKPEVFRVKWERNYTAEEYFGYLMTGNMFINNPEEKMIECLMELKNLEEKYGGIKRTFISELYISKKII